jgi:xanthine dehydrogenase YagT iron-sulfur-binding subunit
MQGSVALGGALATEYASAVGAEIERADTVEIALVVNGEAERLNVEARVTLLDLLRERLALTGAKKGCNQGQCGACTVLVNGRRVNACLVLAVMADGDRITTVEGLAAGDALSPMQSAFVRHDAFQCGFCTSGQICSALGMLDEHAAGMPSAVMQELAAEPGDLSDAEIRERMSGNLCRCGAYCGIVDAIREMADRDSAGGPAR